MDIALMLAVDNYEYTGSVSGNTQQEYQNIVWYDSRQKPTWQSLQSKWNSYYLPVKKQQIIDNINKKTELLIQEKFSFDGYLFGMSLQEQMQYTSISVLYAKSKSDSDVTFPSAGIPIKNKNNQSYTLKANKCNDFFNALLTRYQNIINNDLIQSNIVNAMTTIEQLESYIDPR